jgi:hypothetical protein
MYLSVRRVQPQDLVEIAESTIITATDQVDRSAFVEVQKVVWLDLRHHMPSTVFDRVLG